MYEGENPNPAGRVGDRTGTSDLSSHSRAAFSWPLRFAERRRHARREVLDQDLVPVQLGNDNGGLLLDLSAGGAAVQSVSPLQSSAPSPFAFRLPQLDSQIEGTGTFIWVSDTGLCGGLRFDQLPPASKESLEKWLGGSREATAPAPAEVAPAAAPQPQMAAAAPEIPNAAESTLQADILSSILSPAPDVVASPESSAPPVSRAGQIVEKALTLGNARGACIAIKNEAGALVCEASTGMAPDVGVPINLERGLAAECVATNGIVLCNEAHSDPRVDAATRQQLGFESVALFPLSADKTLFGVMAVFSDQRYAFGEQHVSSLRKWLITSRAVQDLYSELRPASQAIVGLQSAPRSAGRSPLSWIQPALRLLRPVAVAAVATTTLVVGIGWYQHRAVSLPHRVPPAQRNQPSPARGGVPPSPAAPTRLPAASAEVDAVVLPPVNAPSRVFAVTVSPKTPATRPPTPVSAEPVHRAALVEHVPAGSREPAQPQQLPPIMAPPAGSEQRAANVPPAIAAPVAAASRAQQAAAQSTAPPLATPAPVARPVPAPIAHVDVATAVLETRPKAAGNANQLPLPELSSKTEIHYPAGALAQRQQGSVILRVSIGRAGTVDNIQVLDGDPTLSAEAVSAVRQWRYQPYKPAGRAVGADLLVSVNFVLSP